MKKSYINILLLTILLFAAWSCEEADNLDPIGNWELSTPTIVSPGGSSSIVLDETMPNENVTFTWNAAESSVGYGVYYSVIIDSVGSEDFNSPILTLGDGIGTKELSLSVSQGELDEALSLAGYPANEAANLTWGVIAKCIGKTTTDKGDIVVTRFTTEAVPANLYLSGDATENGTDLLVAIPLRRLNGADGNPSNKFELYTHLEANGTYKFYSKQGMPAHQYGGANGQLVKSGDAIVADETGEYRIVVDMDNNTYSLTKFERWNVKGSPIIGGWDGDEPLEYIGGGVWQGSMQLINTGGFLFRGEVNGGGYWDYLLKRVVGTTNSVIMESQAAEQGLSYEDIPSENIGTYIFTLDLSASAYTYTIERDPSVSEELETPEKLFLFADGVKVHEFVKDGDVFNSNVYQALQTGVAYSLNSKEDGSGITYALDADIGVASNPDDPKVTGEANIMGLPKDIAVSRDMAYQIQVDFSSSKLNWSYYNIFLYHWDEINQKWDDRNEFLMTYSHPFTFTVTAGLSADFDMKFISPWDLDFGADDASAMSGNITNKGGNNIQNITTSGSYTVTINLDNEFATGTYEFVQL